MRQKQTKEPSSKDKQRITRELNEKIQEAEKILSQGELSDILYQNWERQG